MRFFRHTIAEYSCVKRCGYHRSVIGATMSPFHLIAAATAGVPLWVYSLIEHLPWYTFVGILSGELLLVFLAGFVSGIFTMPFYMAGTTRCTKCGAAVMLNGRHFDPLGSAKAHWTDITIFVVFIGLNIGVWVAIARGDI